MKSTHELLGNRTRDLSDHSAVPKPTAPPRSASKIQYKEYFEFLGVTIYKNLQLKTTKKCDILQPKRPSSVSDLACNLLEVFLAWCSRNSP
jgi:hypothetical protein